MEARSARASLNALTAKDLAETNPTQALRLAEMNHHLYPKSETAANTFEELVSNTKGAYKKVIKKGHTFSIYAVAFSPDGQSILTGSQDKTAILWDLHGNVLQTFSGHTSEVYSVAFSPDGQSILTGSNDKTAILWDLHGNVLQVTASVWTC